jgi:diaminopimelate decarboxylase
MAEGATARAPASFGPPWPASATFGPAGLVIGGVRAADLAERFGTPLLVFDRDEVRSRMRDARAAFPRVAYAVKAFTAHAVIRLAIEEGLDLLCASGGEVQACLRAGAAAGRILLHGNAKSDDELAFAVRERIGWVVVDGVAELERLDDVARSIGRVQPVLLRVIPEVEVRTHEAIATGHARSKFGTPLGEASDAARRATELRGLRLDGFHAHAGSQVLDVAPFLSVLETLVDLAARVRDVTGVEPRILDVGGGFGVRYVDEPSLTVHPLAETLRDRLASLVAGHALGDPELMVEPGRSLVANAGTTVYRVLARKTVGGRVLVAVDGGMSDNLRPALYDARHAVAAVGPLGGELGSVTVVGRHCESGDVLGEDVELPSSIGPGDLIAMAATGAYTYPLASAYNRIGRPAVVAVADGEPVLWLRREDPADMDRLEVPAPRSHLRATPLEGVEVRPATPGDARSCLALWSAVVAEGRWVRAEEARRSVRQYRHRFRRAWTDDGAEIVAVEGDRVVGHLGIQREGMPATRHVATLGLAVAGDHRGRGIGSGLLAAAFRWARGAGVEKVLLSVYPHNSAAVALYRKFGFLEEGRLSGQSRKSYGYEDEILMAAWIGAARADDVSSTDVNAAGSNTLKGHR